MSNKYVLTDETKMRLEKICVAKSPSADQKENDQ